MSAFTKISIADVQDMAASHGLSPDMEGRFAKQALGLEKTGVSFQRLAPNFRMPFGHNHAEQEEVYVILEGGGRMKLDDEIIDVARHDFIRVAGPTMRAFEAGDSGLTLMAFGAPTSASASPGADSEVVQEWWTD